MPQLILKHNAHAHCTNIVEVADGMDFFYQNKSHALKMLDFVSSVLPVRNRGASEKLISADTKSATANVQMTYAHTLCSTC
jgi:nonsense-mediated mRNA decay protein 3